MRVAVDLRLGSLRVCHHFGWIEHSEPKTGSEGPSQGRVYVFFREQSLFHRIQKLYVIGVAGGLRKEVGALIVHTPPERHGPGFGHTFREVMSTENVSHRIAVRYNVAFEFPGIAQLID